MLCIDFPYDVTEILLKKLNKRDYDVISFEEFTNGCITCLMFEQLFDELNDLWDYMDRENKGEISKEMLLKVIEIINEKEENEPI